ncbi:MAG: T9SS type A sorting domain-containing protein [Saprospiraceae bacterium]
MKKITFLIFISFLFLHQFTYACSCILPTSFCEGIVDTNGEIYADIVFRGEVTGNTSGGIAVQIGQILYGSTGQSTITIGPSFCDHYTDPLDEGTEFIFALANYDNNFFLVPCAISYLKIENEVIKGKIAPGIESLDYFDLANLEGCGNGFNLFSVKNNLAIFPNPTSEILKIQNSSIIDSEENIQVEFIDMIGRALYSLKKEDGILAGEVWTIDLQIFAAGVYFLKLTADNQETILKIVKL